MTETTTAPAEHRCAQCGKTASSKCGGCKEGVDVNGNPSPIFYCGSDCQKINWSTHKADCKSSNCRKQLFRVAEVARQILYDSRRAAFDLNIVEIEEKDGHLHVHEGPGVQGQRLFKFPKDLFANSQDEDALLSNNAGIETVVTMHQFVGSGLKGACKAIQEVSVHVRKENLRIIFASGAKHSDNHCLFKVDLKDGNSYALDPQGSQFGHDTTVMLWDQYCNVFIQDVVSHRSLGSYAMAVWSMEIALRAKPTARPKNTIMILHGQVTQCVNSAMDAWMAKYDSGPAGMLTQGTLLYQGDSEAFVSFVNHHIVLFTNWMKAFEDINPITTSSPDLFKDYVDQRLQEINVLGPKVDTESVAKRKQMIEVDRFPQIAEVPIGLNVSLW